MRVTANRTPLLLAVAGLVFLGTYILLPSRPGSSSHRHVKRNGSETLKATVALSRQLDLHALAKPLMVVRAVGTPGHTQAREYISASLAEAGFTVSLDSFSEDTPLGPKHFSNIVGVRDPTAPRRLVLAAHYDSKLFTDFEFVGATDSAVPCAMLLLLAKTLGPLLTSAGSAVTLQLMFFDGEEAFRDWTSTDSLYGSRHLAARLAEEQHGGGTALEAIELLVLLDLLGAASPQPEIRSFFPQTAGQFKQLAGAERRLREAGLLPARRSIFLSTPSPHQIEDDHIPFLRRGVKVLHLIPVPFPTAWHTAADNDSNVDYAVAQHIVDVLLVFVAERLSIAIPAA